MDEYIGKSVSWNEKIISDSFGKLAYWTSGKGTPIIFLHGGPGDSHFYMRSLAESFNDQHFCIVYDQRGAGKSIFEVSYENFDLNLLLDDINKIFDNEKIKKATLIGHSWGAMLALLYASSYEVNCEKIVLLGCGPLDLNMEKIHQSNITRLFTENELLDRKKLSLKIRQAIEINDIELAKICIYELFDNYRKKEWLYSEKAWKKFEIIMTKQTIPDFCLNNILWQQARNINWWETLKKINISVMMQYGMQDVEPIIQSFLARKYKENVSINLLNECGHFPWLDQPEQCLAAISSFLLDANELSTFDSIFKV